VEDEGKERTKICKDFLGTEFSYCKRNFHDTDKSIGEGSCVGQVVESLPSKCESPKGSFILYPFQKASWPWKASAPGRLAEVLLLLEPQCESTAEGSFLKK
jgi:hypothetical protein